MSDVTISVFTLNCWGIYGVSADRQVRFRAIGQHLATAGYDLVLLQEVWWHQDYLDLCRATRECLPYTHFFDQGIIGSGTCVLSKEPITDATFHEFSANGYPHAILHGDWFAGKGLGVVTLDYRGLNVHVFVSHLHAEYVRKKDVYLGHRVLQALEAAQWVKLTSPGADLTIYAGDFNTEPQDVPYSLLRCLGNLRDSWIEANGPDGGQTCGTEYNTYCTISERAEYPRGKRIDYIMYTGGHSQPQVQSCSLPLAHRIPASLAAVSGSSSCSYSDHEAVAALLRVYPHSRPSPQSVGDCKDGRVCSQQTVADALHLLNKAQGQVARDQVTYSLLATTTLLLFLASFLQLTLTDSLLLECLMFFGRLVLILSGLYFLLMSSIFNRRERHALSAGRATLQLLQTNKNYGSI